MTTYHRFFIPSEYDDSATSGMLGQFNYLGHEIEVNQDAVYIDGIEIGLVDFISRDSPLFRDELDLALRYAGKRKLSNAHLDSLGRTIFIATFQPLCENVIEFQGLLWNMLFSNFPTGLLMVEGGHFQSNSFP